MTTTDANNLPKELIQKIINIGADLRLIEKNSQGGCSGHELRQMASQLREVSNGVLSKLWREAGFAGHISIPTTILFPEKIRSYWRVIVGGGDDCDPRVPRNPLRNANSVEAYRHFGVSPSGLMVSGTDPETGDELTFPPSQSIHLLVEWDKSEPMINGWLFPFEAIGEANTVTIEKFFESLAIHDQGVVITRQDIIRFVALSRDGVHYKDNNPTDKFAEKSRIMSELSQSGVQFRDTIFYLFLSIAQDLVKSPDVKKFIAFANQLEAKHGAF
jgi:hypothetical protein